MTTLTPPKTVAGAPCATCGWPLVSERGATPWCPQCGRNIECYEPERRQREMRWKWADKLSFQTAYDLNRRQFAELSGRPVDKPGFNLIVAALMLIAVVALAFVAGIAAFGVWIMVAFHFWLAYILGAIVIFIAIALRPRFGKLDKDADRVDPADLPGLSRLIDEVAASIGAPRPHTLVFSNEFNASSASYGLLRRRVLTIGLPLWLSLTPQERVALLGHELGHFVNGDVRRGPLTRFGFQVLEHLVFLTTPDMGRSPYGRVVVARGSVSLNGNSKGLAVIGDLISRWILMIFSFIFAMCELVVEWLGMRASHHAEYAADSMAVRVAGSAAAASLFDALMFSENCLTVLRRSLRADPSPEVWRANVIAGRQSIDDKRLRLRQLTMRDDASMYRSHPPNGLRAQLVESRPQSSAAVVLTEADAAQIDRELAAQYRMMRNDIANSN